MLNFLWGLMMLSGLLFGMLTGKGEGLTVEIFDGAKEAVGVCITLLGTISLWSGVMGVAEKAGILESLEKKIDPFITYLFPELEKNHPARTYIATNIIANLFGLGGAATPAGIRAMKELARTNPFQAEGKASDSMCTLLILNISSLQLLPMNLIAYRSQYGSASPAAVVVPSVIATMGSTLVGIMVCRGYRRFYSPRGKNRAAELQIASQNYTKKGACKCCQKSTRKSPSGFGDFYS